MCKLWFTAVVLAGALRADPYVISVQIEQGITSWRTEPGSVITAVTKTPLLVDGLTVIPAGTRVSGHVTRARSVGVGLVHERALLHINFGEYELSDGRSLPMQAQVIEIDNAREQVSSDGSIRGILAAGGTPALARGIWKTPTTSVLRRATAGLTGVPLKFWSEYALGPVAMASMMAFRWVALRFPEPEITLPRGTEMRLAISDIANAPRVAALQRNVQNSTSITPVSARLASLPVDVRKPGGRVVDDMINIGFTGGREEIASVFRAAGWVEADPITRASFTRMYNAWIAMKGYPQAPVSKLLYEGREPDLVFEKSLNTVARRHHIRIWSVGENLWVGAATHDVSVILDIRSGGLSHRIEPRIDLERKRVEDDLEGTGCVQGSELIPRPHLRVRADGPVTDGQLLAIAVGACSAPDMLVQADATASTRRPGNALSRLGRRFALETRHYILRDNAYHWGFVGMRAGFRRVVAWRQDR